MAEQHTLDHETYEPDDNIPAWFRMFLERSYIPLESLVKLQYTELRQDVTQIKQYQAEQAAVAKAINDFREKRWSKLVGYGTIFAVPVALLVGIGDILLRLFLSR